MIGKRRRKFSNSRCPAEYYSNCHNAFTGCGLCRAGRGTSRQDLLYDPIVSSRGDINLEIHPYDQQLQSKRSVLRRARETESDVGKEIVKGTLRSGAALGDGDLHVLEDLRVEVKDRGSRASWNLTWEEYKKGLQQSIDAFTISVICPDNRRRNVYMMTEESFTKLIAQLKEYYESQRSAKETRQDGPTER